MTKLAGVLRARASALALLMAAEMGKPIPQGAAEVEKCAWVCEYYAEHAGGSWPPRRSRPTRAQLVAFEPLGVVLAVMPWNFPFWQVFRFAAPALMAGNAGLLKHASNVPGCALAIEACSARPASRPRLFRDAPGGHRAGGARVIEHPRCAR